MNKRFAIFGLFVGLVALAAAIVPSARSSLTHLPQAGAGLILSTDATESSQASFDAVEVFGFQALLPTRDQVIIESIALNGLPTSQPIRLSEGADDALARDGADARWLPVSFQHIEGLFWGSDCHNFAGEWRTCHERAVTPRSFPELFPSSTRVFGRTPQWAWDGFCDAAIYYCDTANPGGAEARWFWANLSMAELIFDFSHDAELAFAQRMQRDYGKMPTMTFAASETGLAEHWTVASTHDADIHLWIIRDSQDQRMTRWVFAVGSNYNTSSGNVNGTLMYQFLTRLHHGERRFLANRAEDISSVHFDVSRANEVHVESLLASMATHASRANSAPYPPSAR